MQDSGAPVLVSGTRKCAARIVCIFTLQIQASRVQYLQAEGVFMDVWWFLH